MVATKSPRTLSVEEAAKELGISRHLAYEQARTGHIGGIPVLRIGRRLLVPRAALDRVLEGIEVERDSPDVA
jgi:excisionase family DNA binding protein